MACDCCGCPEWIYLFSEKEYRLGRCPECGLHYIDPMPPLSQRMTEMETGHFAGTEEVLRPEGQLASENAQAAALSRYVDLAQKLAAPGKWLDIGCGAGVLMTIARRRGYTPEGIELTAGRRLLAEEVTGLVVHSKPVEDLAISDDAYNVVSLINVFSHLTAPSTTLKEVMRIVSPNGVVVMATGVVGASVKKRHMWNWSLGDHLHFLGEGTLQRYAEQLGFEVVYEERSWAPANILARDQLAVKGRSRTRNVGKALLSRTPGVLPLTRKALFRYQADNVVYPTVFALQAAA